jgi:hypothetical protein
MISGWRIEQHKCPQPAWLTLTHARNARLRQVRERRDFLVRHRITLDRLIPIDRPKLDASNFLEPVRGPRA